MRCSATRPDGRRAATVRPSVIFESWSVPHNNLPMNAPNFSSMTGCRCTVLELSRSDDRVPDARTIWLLREKLTTAGAINRLFEQFDAMLRQAGYIAMSVRSSMAAWLRRRGSAIRTTRRRQ